MTLLRSIFTTNDIVITTPQIKNLPVIPKHSLIVMEVFHIHAKGSVTSKIPLEMALELLDGYLPKTQSFKIVSNSSFGFELETDSYSFLPGDVTVKSIKIRTPFIKQRVARTAVIHRL